MDTIESIYQRRAVKHYDANHQMSEEEIGKLMEATIQSPTSFNIQHWRFVVVTDTELRTQIRAAAWDQEQVTDASILTILTADVNAWAKSPERYWKNAPEEVTKMMSGMIHQFYDGKDQVQRDEAMRSCGIAGQTLMLAAKAMGYDSCPMIGFDADQVAKLIQLPDDHVIGFMITVGKATQPARPKGGQLDLDEVVIRDRFS